MLRVRIALSLMVLMVGASASLVAFEGASDDAAAAGRWKMIVPNLARDAAQATPPPTPQPTPTYDSQRWVNIQLVITAHELAITGTGTSDIRIEASLSAKLPSALDPPSVVSGPVFITPHETDEAGCVWTRTFTKPDLTLTVYHSDDLSILAAIDGPDWYYMAQCPGDPRRPPPVRVPAFGVEGLRYFLQYALEPYRVTEGVRLPTEVLSAPNVPGCIKRSASYTRSAFNADVFVGIYVYQPDYPGGCLLPVWR